MKKIIIVGVLIGLGIAGVAISQLPKENDGKVDPNKYLIKADFDKVKPANIMVVSAEKSFANVTGFEEEVRTNLTSLLDYYNNNNEQYFDIRDKNKFISETSIVAYEVDANRVEFVLDKNKDCYSYLDNIQSFKNLDDLKVSFKNGTTTTVIEAERLDPKTIKQVCSGTDVTLIIDLNVDLYQDHSNI